MIKLSDTFFSLSCLKGVKEEKMRINTTYKLSELIAKQIDGTVSEKEKEELDKWLAESDENKSLFELYSKRDFVENKWRDSLRFNKDAAYNSFLDRKRKSESSLRIRKIAYGVAAVLLPAVLLLSILFMNREIPTEVAHVVENIVPGSSKAVLTLSDGSKVELGENIHDTIVDAKGGLVNAKGSKLEYEAKVAKEELVYNNLNVPRGGEFFLKLSDGTKVWLNSDTKLRYPVEFGAKNRNVYLEGEAFFDVKKDKSRPFNVITKKASVEVLGTAFNIRSYNDEKAVFTTLAEGSVRFSNKQKESITLKPGEQGVVDTKSGTLVKKKVDIDMFTAWKDGRFVFKEQSLEHIMNTMARWYDINVFFVNEEAREVSFSGNLKRYDDFSQLINMLEMTGMATFEVKEKTIYIRSQ